MISFTLPGRIPSKKNSKQLIFRNNRTYFIPSENYKIWQEEQSWRVKKYVPKKPIERCKIEVTIYAPDKRKSDLSNKFESLADLLVDNKILADDNWFMLYDERITFGGVDAKNPRAEITINEI